MSPSTQRDLPNNTNNHQKSQSKQKKKPKNLPKKPLSAYNIFFQEFRIKNKIKKRDNETSFFARLSCSVSNEWKTLDAKTKHEYYQKAAEEKEKYARDMKAFWTQHQIEERSRITNSTTNTKSNYDNNNESPLKSPSQSSSSSVVSPTRDDKVIAHPHHAITSCFNNNHNSNTATDKLSVASALHFARNVSNHPTPLMPKPPSSAVTSHLIANINQMNVSPNNDEATQKMEGIVNLMERQDQNEKVKKPIFQQPSSATVVTDFQQKHASPVITTPLITNLISPSPTTKNGSNSSNNMLSAVPPYSLITGTNCKLPIQPSLHIRKNKDLLLEYRHLHQDNRTKILETEKQEDGQNDDKHEHNAKGSEKKWNDMYLQLMKYQVMNGNCLVPYDYVDEELGHWVHRQRLYSKRQTLSKSRRRRLNEIGFFLDVNDIRMHGRGKIRVNIHSNIDYLMQIQLKIQHEDYKNYMSQKLTSNNNTKQDQPCYTNDETAGINTTSASFTVANTRAEAEYHDDSTTRNSPTTEHEDESTMDIVHIMKMQEFNCHRKQRAEESSLKNMKTLRDGSGGMWNTVSRRLCRYKQTLL